MNDNKGRVLTIRLTVTDHEKSKWIWENHLKSTTQMDNGVQVTAITNGDLFKEVSELEDKLENLK